MMKQKWLISAACFLSAQAFADGILNNQVVNGQKVITLSAGPAWYSSGTTQTVTLQPDVLKTYIGDSETRVLGTAEIFFGIQCLLTNQIYSQFGIAAAYAGNAKLRGDVLEDGDPNFNNFVYRYQLNHGRVGLKGKLLGDFGYWVTPYVSGSVAVAFNHSFDWSLTPKIFEEVPAPPFASNTTTAFAYTVGAGLQAPLNKHWQLGLGYEFADLGKSQLGAAIGQSVNDRFKETHLYTHQLQFSATYLL
ncbi:outer membrane protein [Legionella erythra]|uniref:Outer membrane protein beta-barrel domain-containing protein n=1 Tax=Legionella erythra TaxID=448 RepID=A0A0W0TT86_LEGER|nr:outer membrane beta-barrel protein [Legionella erythra]KTC98570.1 hypothetical protein Lery_0734 [Legionella erythra]